MKLQPEKNQILPQVAYKLYILDWKDQHGITSDIERESLKKYYDEYGDEYDTSYTFDEYLMEFGYNGEFYVSYEEFLQNEYQNASYMYKLFSDEMYTDYILQEIGYENSYEKR